MPLLALHLPNSCIKATACVQQIVTYVHGKGKAMEKKGKLWKNYDTSIGAAAVGKKARLWMKRR